MDKDTKFLLGCCIGDGTITLRRKTTASLTLRHSKAQLDYLIYKTDNINRILGRAVTVNPTKIYDSRTNKFYYGAASSVCHKIFREFHSFLYPNGVKTYTEELMNLLGLSELALLWMDDGNIVPKTRVGRLSLYVDLVQAEIVAAWIQKLTGAVARPELDGPSYRLRFPATQTVKLALAIRDFVIPSMSYKVDLRYKSNTKEALLLRGASLNVEYTSKTLPDLKGLKYEDWVSLAKSCGISYVKSKKIHELRNEILAQLLLSEDDKVARAQGTLTE